MTLLIVFLHRVSEKALQFVTVSFPSARQQFKNHLFAQFIRFVMLHDAQIRVHAADKFYPIFLCWLVRPCDQVLVFNCPEKIAFGAIGNIDAVGLNYGAKKLPRPPNGPIYPI